MSSYFNLTLDTSAPELPIILIEAGAGYTATQLVNCAISTSDGATIGYQMKIWGNVDTSNDSNVQATEGASSWTTFAATKQVKLSSGDGSKTLYLKIRDSVYNESSQASDSISLDTTVPVTTISMGPDVTVVSKVIGKRTCSFSFQCDSIFDEYKIKVVPATDSINSAGTQIETTNGSTNMSGNAGDYPALTNINCIIDGADLEIASSGDGTKIIKVFTKDKLGLWSIV
ncbi:MAG: hypothetical protein WC979_07915 [Candidatus Pacearchaeota archaeon]|jgi:hypothetical protein